MRVALDYTPAVEQIAGVGRYTRSLFAAMQRGQDPDVEWTLWHTSERDDPSGFPHEDEIQTIRLPLSARWSNMIWHRAGLPVRIERYIGPASVIHGPDFVVPPSKAPSVVTVHDLSYALLPHMAYPRLRSYLERAVPRSINRARKVIAVSETTKRDLCEYYEISPNRVEVVHHAADPLFRPPPRTSLLAMRAQFGLRSPYFIIVGTVEPRKDHLTLLRAFEQVHEACPESSLVVVGREGWLAEETMRAIGAAADRIPVIHLQGIKDEALPALYAGSTALVYPSRYEGFGLPLLEAMACGAPAIASNTPAHREIAGDSVLYAPVGDVDALADQMKRILEDRELRADYANRGIERASRYSWDLAAKRHLEIYREVAGE